MAGFVEYKRPPRRRGGPGARPPFLSIKKDRRYLTVSYSAQQIIQLRPGLDRVTLLIDRDGRRLGIRLDKEGAYRFNKAGTIHCPDFLIDHPIKPDRYPCESPSRNVLSAHIAFLED